MTQLVPPQLGAESFSCPHCGAFSHQSWDRVFIQSFENDRRPASLRYREGLRDNLEGIEDEERRKRAFEFADRLEKNNVTYTIHAYSTASRAEMVNLYLSQCFSRKGFAVWINEDVVYPITDTTIIGHEEMPNDVKADFDEAANIVAKSPRGAAALLRLCVQKLVIVLGQKGENLNHDIGELARTGTIDRRIQQALDLVRVVGNNAVHPGQIDLNDNKAIAMNLFNLVNVIVEATISAPKHIQDMYQSIIPETVRAKIEERDTPKHD
jgi:hypothetical protein